MLEIEQAIDNCFLPNFKCEPCRAEYPYSKDTGFINYHFNFEYRKKTWLFYVSHFSQKVFFSPIDESAELSLSIDVADKFTPSNVVEKLSLYLLFS